MTVIFKLVLLNFIYGTCSVNVLILGGNGFIGSHVVENFKNLDYNVTLINRGNVYFDTKKRMEINAFRTFTCDRNTLLKKSCHSLLTDDFYDFVLDFSSYQKQHIEQTIDILKSRVGLYIFLSTDAVYELKSSKSHTSTHAPRYLREDGVRSELDYQTKKMSKYASNKLDCEKALVKQRQLSGFPYVILRLATVIGERDTTLRWWVYQTLMKVHKYINVKVPLPIAVMKLNHSMVYVGDVAAAIMKILKKSEVMHDQTINLAFKEDINLEKILQSIADCLKMSNVTYDYNIDTAWFKYPAVQVGPIDTYKAKNLLEWSPITFLNASNITCNFFERAMTDFHYVKDKELMLAELLEEALPDSFEDELQFFDVLKKEYGIEVMKGIDLGVDEPENMVTDGNTDKLKLEL
ncbi:uncharacterized protein LOC105847697 [Hydra vulgaris]|uniref:Uncharacterized protein LOC105847697 n=1 Tax=Hydra vulgaris TaxID=6087 RepID=A0ABM4CYQ3_HYDVU